MANAFEEDAETETDHESDLRLLRSAREHAALARHAAERAAQAGDNCAQAIGQLLGELQEHKNEDETAHGEISAHLDQVEHLAVHTNKTVTAISEKLRIAIAPLGTPGAFRPISEMDLENYLENREVTKTGLKVMKLKDAVIEKATRTAASILIGGLLTALGALGHYLWIHFKW